MAQKQEIPKQQKIALAVIGVVGLYMLYSNVYAPMGDKIKDAENKLKQKTTELEDMRFKAADVAVLETELRLLEEQLTKTEEKLPHSEELPGFIRLITESAARYNMDVRTLTIGAVQSSQYYNTHTYGMNLTSDYHTLARFFAEIGQFDRIFNIRNLSLNPTGDEEQQNMVNASFQLVAFTFKQ